MPIFEFRCDKCSQIFELLAMKTNDQIEAKCPHCGGDEITRVMSAANCAVSDGGGQISQAGGVQSRSCSTGDCATITLPGHTR